MSVWIKVDLPDGMVWAGLSDFGSSDEGCYIAVKEKDIHHLSDVELANCVRHCAKTARYAQMLNYMGADCLTDRSIDIYVAEDRHFVDTAIKLCEEFKDIDGDAGPLLERLKAGIARYEARQAARKVKAQKRRDVAAAYDHLFVAVGKRDGFKCAKCGELNDLHLDHIVPLALNGSNDLDNLQLLCRTCNIQKRDTIADYRKKES